MGSWERERWIRNEKLEKRDMKEGRKIYSKRGMKRQINTHTHTHTHTYIYMCVCECVFVCVEERRGSEKDKVRKGKTYGEFFL